MVDLQSATSDELLDELERRFVHVMFVGLNEKEATDEMAVRYKGNLLVCAGLAQYALQRAVGEFGGTVEGE